MRIDIRALTKLYGGTTCALNGIDLSLESPSMVRLVGPNGAGKTTLMNLLVAQLLPSSGDIHVDGTELLKQERAFKRRLGSLPQEFGLYDELTVYQFLDYLACLKGINYGRKHAISASLAKASLEEKTHARIGTLSGGQKQRVGIAQALLNQPELLIVDEPTVGLDPEERIRFRNLVSQKARRQLVILSTHIIDDVESICDRLIVLDRGVVLFDGPPSGLVRRAEGRTRRITTCLARTSCVSSHVALRSAKTRTFAERTTT